MIVRINRVLIALTFLVPFNSFADSDGVVAFGDNFIAYTSFSINHWSPEEFENFSEPSKVKFSSGQSLNVVSFLEGGTFSEILSAPLPVSNSEIVIKKNLIFVRWFKKIFVYEFEALSHLKLLKEFDIFSYGTKKILNSEYSILPYENGVLIFTSNGTHKLDINKEISEWSIEEVIYEWGVKESEKLEKIELTDRKKNRKGDWVPRYGTCLKKIDYTYCLAYAESVTGEENGYVKFNDKLLVTRKRYDEIINILPINSSYETIH